MRSIVATLKRSGLLVLGFAGSVLAQGSLPRPLPVYFLEVRTNIAGESATVAEDITTSMETAFSSRRQSFRLIEKRDLGEVERQILANLEVGKKPSPALIAKARSAYGFVRGELVRRDDGVELRVKMIAMDSEILWAQEKTLSLLKWKDGEARREVAAWLAADAEAQVFSVPVQPGPPARKPEDAEMGINAASKGDCAKARPFLENASAIDPNNAEVYFWLSRCQNLEGQSQAAGESATHGLLAKQRPDLFLERAVSLLARGQTSAAIQGHRPCAQNQPKRSGGTRTERRCFDATGRLCRGHFELRRSLFDEGGEGQLPQIGGRLPQEWDTWSGCGGRCGMPVIAVVA